MGIARDHRFSVTFDEAFGRGLVLVGEVSPDNEYQQDRNKPARQKVDELTGKRRWKARCTDPAAGKAKNASIEVIVLADVQPVPTTTEIVQGLGMRQVQLEGLMVQPTVVGSSEYRGQGFVYVATGFKASATAARVGRRLASRTTPAAASPRRRPREVIRHDAGAAK